MADQLTAPEIDGQGPEDPLGILSPKKSGSKPDNSDPLGILKKKESSSSPVGSGGGTYPGKSVLPDHNPAAPNTQTVSDSRVKPLIPGNAPSMEEVKNAPTVQQKHDEELKKASQNIDKTLKNIHPTAVNYLEHQNALALKRQMEQQNSMNGDINQPAITPNIVSAAFKRPTLEDVNNAVADPNLHPALIAEKAKELKADGKNKEADTLLADAYTFQRGIHPGDRELQLNTREQIQKGEADFNPKTGEVTKTLHGIEGAAAAGAESVRGVVQGVKLLTANDEEKAKMLNDGLKQTNPDIPTVKIGGLENFIGGQIPMLAAGAIPGIGAGLVTAQMASQGYKNGMEQTYAQLKTKALKEKYPEASPYQIQELLSKPDEEIDKTSLEKAKTVAVESGLVDAVTAHFMGKMGGKEIPKTEIKPFSISAQEAVKAALGAGKTAALFGTGQAVKNLALEAQGGKADDNSVSEAMLQGGFLHAGFFAMAKGSAALGAGAS